MSAEARRGRRSQPSPSGGGSGGGLSRAERDLRERDLPERDLPEGDLPEREPQEHADPESVARTIVLRQLSVTARTRSDLAKTLAKRNVPDSVAAKVLDRMTEVGLIDDAAYAHEWVRQRQQGKGLARRALADELRRKGVDDDVAAAALGTVDEEAERGKAFELATRKARASRGQPYDKRVRSLAGMLARKGYSSGLAFAVVRDVLHAEGVEFDD